MKKICKNGHAFFKTSDCLVCPICEKLKKPKDGFLGALSAPARRALENAGLTTLSKLSKKTERYILELHGMGPSSIPKLRSALRKEGLLFKK